MVSKSAVGSSVNAAGLRVAYLFASSLVKATDEHVELLDRYRHGDGWAARQ